MIILTKTPPKHKNQNKNAPKKIYERFIDNDG